MVNLLIIAVFVYAWFKCDKVKDEDLKDDFDYSILS